MKQVSKHIGNVVKGDILGHPEVSRHIPFLLFLLLLALIIIGSAHSADQKTRELSILQSKHKEIKSEYIETKSALMKLSTETQVIEQITNLGLVPQEQPPKKLIENGGK